MESNQDFIMKGTNVITEANAQMEIKAGATMDVKSSTKMTVDGGALMEQKAAIIKIN